VWTGGRHGCATFEAKEEDMTAMQWDSATAALEEIDAAVQGIADADATLKLLAEAKQKLDEQLRAMREVRQRAVMRRDRAMNSALDGKVKPDDVAARADMKVTAMYQAVARSTGARRRGGQVTRRAGGSSRG
jgi:hypothetical protein